MTLDFMHTFTLYMIVVLFIFFFEQLLSNSSALKCNFILVAWLKWVLKTDASHFELNLLAIGMYYVQILLIVLFL